MNFLSSNNIGVGILSFNRAKSLQRLLYSIYKFTDLNKTTIFISDDCSTDGDTIAILDMLYVRPEIVVLRNQQRLGVAGNTNRLMRCLKRFEHCLLLNDDVEILQPGWEYIYPDAQKQTGILHFCRHQTGVYGGRMGARLKRNDVALTVIGEKPQGALLYYHQSLHNKIGYFDSKTFGYYGLEHVDWSMRAKEFNTVSGFLDVATSENFFRTHPEPSAVPNRIAELTESRARFANLGKRTAYIDADKSSEVPAVRFVVRHERPAVKLNLVAQRFPVIEFGDGDGIKVIHRGDVLVPFDYAMLAYQTIDDACFLGRNLLDNTNQIIGKSIPEHSIVVRQNQFKSLTHIPCVDFRLDT